MTSATTGTGTAGETSGPGSSCGDGMLDPGEQCDDGNAVNSDECLNNCTSAICGDGVVAVASEACDDDNDLDDDACTNACTLPSCGDGILQAGEACDDGDSDDANACTNACALPSCGDGILQAGEACDDGDQENSNGCLSSCELAFCGDGYVYEGVEGCDDGNGTDDDGCTNACALPSCGDGILHRGEQCDDQNDDDTDDCLSTCVTASCGDGYVQEGTEECDDHNDIDQDACLSSCVLASCGDGYIQEGAEECDDQNNDDSDACLSACTIAVCGDSAVHDGFEACDDGNQINTDGCLNNCELPTSCKAILEADPGAQSGTYTLDTGEGSFYVYCDMVTDGGGWTLIARFANHDLRNWMLDSGEWWYDRVDVAGFPLNHSDLADAFSPAFYQVVADELKISRTDHLDDAHLLMTDGGCLGGKTFRAHITGYGEFKDGVPWGDDSVKGTCSAVIGAEWKGTNGFQYADCTDSIGEANSISFWADWGVGDGAVMMIGGGGPQCARADHGIGITEANAANFINGGFEDDFGVDGNDGANNNTYALNLFVR